MDEWKEIEVRGYRVQVSRSGEVWLPEKRTDFEYTRSGKTVMRTAVFRARKLRPSKNHMGYMEVSFSHKRKVYKLAIHRLVAMAFVPGYVDGLTVNHRDGDKMNNDPSNLEWITKGANTKHAWQAGLIPLRGEDNPGAKLTREQVAYIRKMLNKGVPARPLAKIAGVSDSLVCLIRDGERWADVPAAR